MNALDILAQAAQDISAVPADFVKNWWIMLGFALTIFLQWRGSQAQKREISGEVTTTPKAHLASQEEVESLRSEFTSFVAQNRSEHQAAISAGQQRVMNLSEVMDRETSELETAMNELREALSQKMDAAFAALHSKIDPLISQGASSGAIITQMDKRLTRLESEHSNEVGKLHSRIDDAIRTSLTTHARPAK